MIKFRPFQFRAIDFLASRKRGLIRSPAGSGKTIMAAGAIHRVYHSKPRSRSVRVGWVAPTKEICQQAESAIAKFPGMDLDLKIACAAGDPDMSDRDCLIVDEAQHCASSPLWQGIVARCRGAVWGFSATPGEGEAMESLMGIFREMFTVDRSEMGANLASGRVLMYDDTDPGLRDEIDRVIQDELARFRKFMPKAKIESEMWPKVAYRVCLNMGIRDNAARNARVMELLNRHPEATRLALVNSKEHGAMLAEGVPGAVVAHSKMGARNRREAMAAIVNEPAGCMIATSVLDEGFDCPRATVLVMACGGKAAGRVEQRTGRVLRAFVGKAEGIIYDFHDLQHPLLASHARKRQEVYRALGYTIEEPAQRLLL